MTNLEIGAQTISSDIAPFLIGIDNWSHRKSSVSQYYFPSDTSIRHQENCLKIRTEETGSSAIMDDEQLLSEYIKELVQNGHVSKARKILLAIQSESSKKLDNWRKILALPKVQKRNSATGGNVRSNSLWLKENSSLYRGKWVALKDGTLLYAHKYRVELHNYLKQIGKLSGAMCIRIEN